MIRKDEEMRDVLGEELEQGDLVVKSAGDRSGSNLLIGIYKGKSLYGFGELVAWNDTRTLLNNGTYKRVSRLNSRSVLKLDKKNPKYKELLEEISKRMNK